MSVTAWLYTVAAIPWVIVGVLRGYGWVYHHLHLRRMRRMYREIAAIEARTEAYRAETRRLIGQRAAYEWQALSLRRRPLGEQ